MPKYVVTTTLEKADWANARCFARDPVEEVSRLKQEPGGEILTHGFGQVAKTLLAHGLLDELHLWVHPVFAGVGAKADMLFDLGMNVRLSLVGHRPLASGVIMLTYQSVPAKIRHVTREVTTMTTIEVEQREPQPVLSIRQNGTGSGADPGAGSEPVRAVAAPARPRGRAHRPALRAIPHVR